MYVHPRGSHEIPLIGCERAIGDLFAGIKQIFGEYVMLNPLFIANVIDVAHWGFMIIKDITFVLFAIDS